MPTEAPRKSSIGNLRRGPPKAHVPYRGDNREVGKKTGVKIPRVQPGSDGFEPFENVIGQADAMTPYQVKGRKRNGSLAAGEVDPGDDDEGERSMDIDSPFDYISNSRQPISPALSRVGSSRAVARPSMNNFDELPSPHLRTGFNARGANGHSAGPSRLSRHFPSDGEDDLSINNNTFDDFDPEPPESSPQHHRSFTELDQDGDDADPSSPAASPRSLKQRQRQTPRRSPSPPVDPDSPSPPQSDIEMEPPQDYDDPMQQEEEEEEEEEAPPKKKPSPPPKKAKEVQKKAVTKSGGKKENREVIPGTRRSSRKVYKPLEYWRNERVVYGRPNNGHILVPHIKEIIRIPEEPKAPLGTNKRKRGRSKTVQPRDGSVARVQSNPEEGWDDKTPEKSFVIDWKTKTEVEKRESCLLCLYANLLL
ncbi:mitotic fidelity of chromosome transmission-related protein, variant 2 [Stygiomarasmius scandens]|uniref:Mitotic fidelity of chromosome transmission-related protein, variant 2 n=1 Tax=Marasmiellus scandens TaxID=2682957 RepID=A0ABR1K042_9AGAR